MVARQLKPLAKILPMFKLQLLLLQLQYLLLQELMTMKVN